MTKRVRFGRGLFAVLSISMVACASGGSGGGGEPDAAAGAAGAEAATNEITIEVQNDVVPGAAVVLWIVPETGSRRRLGSIESNDQQSFRYTPTARDMDHHLVAEKSGGGEESSNRFSLVGVSGLSWQISSPNVALTRVP
ncbi:MAG: hypothetical protein ACREM1_04165 [Longimicrobiales bacterium]